MVVNFRLPEDLVTRAEVAAEATHRNRTEIITEALREYLDDIESNESFQEGAVDLYIENEIEFETLTQIIGPQEAQAIQPTKRLLDQDDNLADRLSER